MTDLKEMLKNRLTETFAEDTQEVTARKLNTTQGNVSKWVNGQQVPTADMLRDISKAYKVSVDWLLGISDEKEIDGIVLDKLTYEQVARIIDRLIEWGTITIPDLQEINNGDTENSEYKEELRSKNPNVNSDYMKVNDRVLSHMLRRRLMIYKIGEDMKDTWKLTSVSKYRGLKLLPYKGNIEDAIDTRPWATYNADGDWVELVQELGSMTEEKLTVLIENAKKKRKDWDKNG